MQPVPPGHTTVMVPAGHTVQIHAPQPQMELPTGMIAQPAVDGAKAAMDAALGPPQSPGAREEAAETPAQEAQEQAQGSEQKEPVHKKKKKKAAAK